MKTVSHLVCSGVGWIVSESKENVLLAQLQKKTDTTNLVCVRLPIVRYLSAAGPPGEV